VLSSFCSTLWAADLLGTAKVVSDGLLLEVGLANDGEDSVSGLQFDINVNPLIGGLNDVDLSSCLSGLPRTFSASTCTVIDDSTLRVVILSMTGEIVPSTMVGTVRIPIAHTRGQLMRPSGDQSVQFSNVVMGDSAGNRIEPSLIDFSLESPRNNDQFGGSKRKLIRP